jgi:hypothetical protein
MYIILIQIIIHISYEVIKYMTSRDVQCAYSSLSCHGSIYYTLTKVFINQLPASIQNNTQKLAQYIC